MKTNLLRFFILPAIILISCQKDIFTDSPNQKVESAKEWWQANYKSYTLHSTFTDIVLDWNQAQIFSFKNGYEIVSVPLKTKRFNVEYRGKQKILFYKRIDNKGYFTRVIETISDVEYFIKQGGKINPANFSGVISIWDLQKGFVKGVKFQDGEAIGKIKSIVERNDFDYKEIQQTTSATSTTLPNVTVTASRNSNNVLVITYTVSMTDIYDLLTVNNSNPCEYSNCVELTLSDIMELIDYYFNSQFDDIWKDSCIKDSSNNPCIGDALNTLGGLEETLPKLIRDFFNCNANFNMTIKYANLGTGLGAETVRNLSDKNFQVNINSYYDNATNLATAGSIIHEALHCQLMSWYQDAVLSQNRQLQEQLAADWGYMFSREIISFDSTLAYIVNGTDEQVHGDMAARYRSLVSQALQQFANSKGINISSSWCDDLAWSGCTDSEAFQKLSLSNQNRIKDRINAEKDPDGSKNLNRNNDSPKGTPCN